MNFNPRSRKESDLCGPHLRCSVFIFQSTLSQGERPTKQVFFRNCDRNFNPRSRKESDVFPWGGNKWWYYFNPRSRKESDCPFLKKQHACSYFNPRSRKESDAGYGQYIPMYLNFNPRSRKESDRRPIALTRCCRIFQSTLSQGERRPNRVSCWVTRLFQSTLSQGERLVPYRLLWRHWKISIHALARRATNLHYRVSKCNGISIHALARRATSAPFPSAIIVFNFNPRSRKESDCCHKSLKGTKK